MKSLPGRMVTFARSSRIIMKPTVQWSLYMPKLSERIRYFKRVCRSYLNKWQGQRGVYWSTGGLISMMRVWR